MLAATSKNFGYNMSIMILVFVVLGGIGNIRGSITVSYTPLDVYKRKHENCPIRPYRPSPL